MRDEQIFTSHLDTDFYKFPMAQAQFKDFRNTKVKWKLKNRTKGVNLANIIPESELREHLDEARKVQFTGTELRYLRGIEVYSNPMFSEDFLLFLKNFQLPEYYLERFGDQWILEFEGPWCETTFWEIPDLFITSELYAKSIAKHYSRFEKERMFAEGIKRFAEKKDILRWHPGITVSDFATRRRAFKSWHEKIVEFCKEELPKQFLGTSNVHLAMKHDLVPIGTSAHEMFMAMVGIWYNFYKPIHETEEYTNSEEVIRSSHNATLENWWKHYGWGLSIALTDTFGSKFAFETMPKSIATDWKGLRQDSGNPFEFGKQAIKWYKSHGVDPKEKLIIFSDGLDVVKIVDLYRAFEEKIKVSFGWGTNLGNDIGIKPLSLVIKLVEACGHRTVKLSDNIAKAIGKPEDIERFKKIFAYSGNFNEECVY